MVIGNETRYGMEFSLELSREQQEEVGALACLAYASSSTADRNSNAGHSKSTNELTLFVTNLVKSIASYNC